MKSERINEKVRSFYIANKSENLYFTLLGDCSESSKEKEDFDKGVIEEGKKQIEILNKKYSKEYEIPIFNFVYRKEYGMKKKEVI